jgi:hypothetical protein
MLLNVTKCNEMLKAVKNNVTLNVTLKKTKCQLPNVTKCYIMLQNVNKISPDIGTVRITRATPESLYFS